MVRSPVWPRNGPEAWSRMDRDNHRRWLWLVLGEGAEQTRPQHDRALQLIQDFRRHPRPSRSRSKLSNHTQAVRCLG